MPAVPDLLVLVFLFVRYTNWASPLSPERVAQGAGWSSLECRPGLRWQRNALWDSCPDAADKGKSCQP